MAEKYGRQVEDMTLNQIETDIHKALAEAIPPDAFNNMPIGKIEEAQAAALKNLAWLPDIGDIIGLPKPKCKAVCKLVLPTF